MPRKPQHPCGHLGCPNLVPIGEQYCAIHKKQKRQQYDKQRGSAQQRGYTAQWNKIRKMILSREPLCRRCAREGKTTAAVIVHHIIPKDQGGRDSFDNLEPLCIQHHEEEHKMKRWG